MIEKIIELALEIIQNRCDCDTDMDKETGDLPSDMPNRILNFHGEAVWANDICDYCLLQQAIKEYKESK